MTMFQFAVPRLSIAAGALLVGLVLSSPCAQAQNSEKYGGSLNYAERESVNEFNPYQRQEPRPASDRLYTLIYETLVDYNYESEEVEPSLATDWTVSPKGAQTPEQITFELREDVRWHDGERFTAEDVAFTYRYVVRASANEKAYKRFGGLIEAVRADADANTVTFDLVRPTPKPAQRFSSLWIIPEHKFDEKYVPEDEGQSLGRSPVGTGPYRFVERSLEGNVMITAFESYWGEGPFVAETELRPPLDPSTMANQTIAGNIQLIVETPPEQIGRLEQSGEVALKSYQSLSFNAFGYNNNHPILGLQVVRRALTRAVDRTSLLKEWYANKGRVIGGPLVPGHPYFNPDIQPREHDPERARTLLSEAGYEDRDGDGIRETVDGDELRFQLVTLKPKAAGSTRRQNVAQSYASQLEEVGVQIDVVSRVRSEYLELIFQKKDFDIAWVSWEFDPSYDISSLFRSRNNDAGGDNVVNYNNQKVDKLIRGFKEAGDPEAKRNYMYSIQEEIHDDVPYTFLYTIEKYAAIDLGLVYTRIDPYYFFQYYNSWYIEPGVR
jgi:peptide/nickel transport system substrate-binding protein